MTISAVGNDANVVEADVMVGNAGECAGAAAAT